MIRKVAETAVVFVLVASVPAAVSAQESGSEGAQDDAAAESEGATQQAEGDGGGEGAEEKGGKNGGENTGAEEEGSSETPETGPGGREMREDYPGTEESKKKRMETDRIEGLDFQEGSDPSEAYDVEIQELESKIDDLKEDVFQSKSRVVLLKETVLGGNLSGSRGTIVHQNELGARFKLQRVLYSLDGSQVFDEVESEKLNKKKFQVYDGSVTPGNHNVSVLLEYQGSGYGVFNYMKDYQFRVQSSCQFKAEEGEAVTVQVRTVGQGGAFTKVENKPGIRCEVEKEDLSDQRAREVGGQSGDGSGNSGSEEGGG